MAKTFLLLLVVSAVAALQYLGITGIVDSGVNFPLWAIIFSTALIANSITAVIFSALTGLEQKIEIAMLQLDLANINRLKGKISNWPALQLVTKTALIIEESFFDNKMKEFELLEKENYRLKKEVTVGIDLGKPGEDKTAFTTHPGKGHMKGKKLSEETRRKISESAKAREAAKREQKVRMEEHRERNAKKRAVKNA